MGSFGRQHEKAHQIATGIWPVARGRPSLACVGVKAQCRTSALAVLALVAALAGCHGPPKIVPIDWRTSPLDLNLRGMVGSRYAFHCAPGKPQPALLTGTGVYTDASSICTAAVHAGAIDPQHGGDVVIQILRGQTSYQGSTQNFVHSKPWPQPWGGSFAVLGSSLDLMSLRTHANQNSPATTTQAGARNTPPHLASIQHVPGG